MKITALAGGVGGAKLVDGLARCMPAADLTVIVNTGDDFDHFGLRICPDLDTVCYTLAGIANPATGWGRAGETWNVLESLRALDAPSWFALGDADLGTHLERTRRLAAGETLSQVTAAFCRAWGIAASVLPMSDDRVSTIVQTRDDGDLPFQDYFVRRRCEPVVTGFRFEGLEVARPAPGVLESLHAADVVILAPSNPWVSIGPIAALPGVMDALQAGKVVAVSPLLGGQAVKGPAAKMYRDLGINPSSRAVAEHYQSFLDAIVVDHADQQQASEIEQWGIISMVTDILIPGTEERQRLAKEILAFCGWS